MERENDSVSRIYIVPHRIQKQRLRDIQNSMTKKKLPLSLTPENATYIVSEYDTLEQVKEQLKKNAMVFSDNAFVVTMKWLVECLKASKIVPVEESHKIKQAVIPPEVKASSNLTQIAEWACQRGAKLMHPNKIFSEALEILQEYAELRDNNQDYSRALAFRRASCVLKSLPAKVTDIHQLIGIKDIGDHASTVIADIIDQGFSHEVEDIRNSDWFKKMKLFTGVFGVGPSTAKKWIDRGWNSIDDVIAAGNFGSDWRIAWGLAFFSDLNSPVALVEATAFYNIVKEEAENILPGVIVSLVGGFRRGKTSGHDVDILLSHPEEGKEIGLLAKLLRCLEKRQLLLIGHSEKNSFRPEILYQDFKLSVRGQLDHFEKWLGICKFPKIFQEELGDSTGETKGKSGSQDCCHTGKEKAGPCEHLTKCKNSSACRDCSDETSMRKGHLSADVSSNKSMDESLDNDSFEPLLKKSRREGDVINEPMKLSTGTRDWTARRVDMIVSSYSQYFYALVGWTGSKHFNRDARLFAQNTLGMKLTSHGLHDSKKQESVPATSEEEVFRHLNIPYRPPCERNC